MERAKGFNDSWKSFVDFFYFDFSDEDPEYIREYLVIEGINIEQLQQELLELIAKRRANLKLKEGRKFKSRYEELNKSQQKCA
jgi:hypothetical protein